MTGLILKEVKLNGQEVQTFNLLSYRHLWMDAYRVVVHMASGWQTYEIVKWEQADPPVLLVRHIGRLSDLPVEVLS